MSNASRIRLGVLTRTYGLAGGVRLSVDSDAIPTIATPCDVSVGFSESFTETLRLERFEDRGTDLICYFAGITVREAAERLLDRALFVSAEVLGYREPLSNPQLVGYDVLDESGEMLGRIGSIFRTPAHFIWMVESDAGEWMLPAIDAFVVEIRHEERKAITRPIPGMVTEEPEHGES